MPAILFGIDPIRPANRPHRRRLGANQLQRKRHERYPLPRGAIEVVEIRQGHDPGLAQGAGSIEDARSLGFIDAVIEVVAHQYDAFVDAPAGAVAPQIRRTLHPVVDHVGLVYVGPQEKTVATPYHRPRGSLEFFGGNGLPRNQVPQVGDHGGEGLGPDQAKQMPMA
jgi:hypothetical protein